MEDAGIGTASGRSSGVISLSRREYNVRAHRLITYTI
jgi:hypothetical protein